MKVKYKSSYNKDDHYFKIVHDLEYFLISFKNMVYKEVKKPKYDIKSSDEFDDLISESYKILIELYGKMQVWFGEKYKDKPTIEKAKILQVFIRASYTGRLFNWWCKWRNLKYIANPGGKGKYVKMVFNGFEYDSEVETVEDTKNDEYKSPEKECMDYNFKNSFIDRFIDIEGVSIDRINIEIFWKNVLNILNDSHYSIFYMYYREKLSYEDIVKKLNISKQKVTTIKWYSDQKVKKYFKDHNIFGDKNG